MNKNTTYEQLIAQKLEQLAVPDSADAIWASIEQQLDVVMPVNAPTGTPASSTVFKNAGQQGIIIAAAVVVIIVALFIADKFNSKNILPTPTEKSIPIPPVPQKIYDTNKIIIPQQVQPSAPVAGKVVVISAPVDTAKLQKITPLPIIIDKKKMLIINR
ncbi:MAG: hypothetical protein IPJ81_07600 [Chitinophagaceae bacterium]|nr:hypothetical protein [Chitinophagaceae bacterium]